MKFLQEEYKISAGLAGIGGGIAALGMDIKTLMSNNNLPSEPGSAMAGFDPGYAGFYPGFQKN